jgi:hypothetical protein
MEELMRSSHVECHCRILLSNWGPNMSVSRHCLTSLSQLWIEVAIFPLCAPNNVIAVICVYGSLGFWWGGPDEERQFTGRMRRAFPGCNSIRASPRLTLSLHIHLLCWSWLCIRRAPSGSHLGGKIPLKGRSLPLRHYRKWQETRDKHEKSFLMSWLGVVLDHSVKE